MIYNLISEDKKYLFQVIITKKLIVINARYKFHIIEHYICDYKLSEFQELYLIKKQDIMDKLEVPKMSKYETYGRYIIIVIIMCFLIIMII